jgi:hypothetical protein
MEKKLFSALSKFQKKCPVIHKGTQGYGYSYADLVSIFEVINPILGEFDLGFAQPICGSKVKTILFHTETGETLESETDIPQNVQLKGMNDFQVLGSAITYIRRYAISSMLGIITDKDIDGAGEQQKKQPETVSQAMPFLNVGTPEWTRAIELLSHGYLSKDGTQKECTIADLRKKFRISSENQKLLQEQVLA